MPNNIQTTVIISLLFATTAGADTCVLHLYFPFDSATIDNTTSLVMQQFVAYNKRVQTGNVAGFADRVGTASYNIDLSKRRAQNVVESLRSLSAGRIQLNSTWYGYAHPVVSTPNPEILNRRVEIVADKCTRPWLFNPMPQPLAAYELLLTSPANATLPKDSHVTSGAAYSSDSPTSPPSGPAYVSVTSGPGTASAAVGAQTGNTAAASTDTTGSRAAATSGTTTSSSFAGPTSSSSATSSPGQATAAYAGSTSASAASSMASSAHTSYSGAGSVATSSGGTSVSVGPSGISISKP